MSAQSTESFLVERCRFVERCLLDIAQGRRAFDEIVVGEKNGKKYLECPSRTLNSCLAEMAAEEGGDYEASSSQLAALFSANGGRLFANGWRRVFARAIRGVRIYRFITP